MSNSNFKRKYEGERCIEEMEFIYETNPMKETNLIEKRIQWRKLVADTLILPLATPTLMKAIGMELKLKVTITKSM